MPAHEPDCVVLRIPILDSRLLFAALDYILKEQAQPSWWLADEEQSMHALRSKLRYSLEFYDEQTSDHSNIEEKS